MLTVADPAMKWQRCVCVHTHCGEEGGVLQLKAWQPGSGRRSVQITMLGFFFFWLAHLLFDVSLFQAEHDEPCLPPAPSLTYLLKSHSRNGRKNTQKPTNYPASAIETNSWWEKWSVCDTLSDRRQMHCAIKRNQCFAGSLRKQVVLHTCYDSRDVTLG